MGKSHAHLGVVCLGAQCVVLPMQSHPLIFDREILDVFRGKLDIEEKVRRHGTMAISLDLESLSNTKN